MVVWGAISVLVLLSRILALIRLLGLICLLLLGLALAWWPLWPRRNLVVGQECVRLGTRSVLVAVWEAS